jgi:hypothetical protein
MQLLNGNNTIADEYQGSDCQKESDSKYPSVIKMGAGHFAGARSSRSTLRHVLICGEIIFPIPGSLEAVNHL